MQSPGPHWNIDLYAVRVVILQKFASDPRPPHTRQKYEQTSGHNMTPHASKQGKFGSLGAVFLFIFLPCVWGLGFQKESPLLKSLLQSFQPQGQWCVKNSPPMGPDVLYTTGSGEEVKVSVANFASSGGGVYTMHTL